MGNEYRFMKERDRAIVYFKALLKLRKQYGQFGIEYVYRIDSLLDEEVIPWLKEIGEIEDNTETNDR